MSIHWATSAREILCKSDSYSFEDMAIWFFCRFDLKCLFTPPKNSFLGSEPLNVIGHHRDPQRHIIGRNRAYMPILVQIGPLVRPVSETKKSKKEKRQGKKLTVANGVFAQTTHVDAAICGLAYRVVFGGGSKFQVSSKSVERFLRCWVEIWHFIYLRPVAYKQLLLPYKPWLLYFQSNQLQLQLLRYGNWLQYRNQLL